MTIQEMLEREDIYGILSTTLEEYFREVCDNDVQVKVEKSVFKNSYVIYPLLGVVVSRIPSWKVAKDIYTQFNVQGNIKRKVLAWGYITLCFLTFGLLASCSLYISEKKWCKRYRYIMPCNRKIRIFDYKDGVVDAILKTGFNDTYFKNEMKYRVNPEYSFIPPVIANGERWYREKIIVGTGLVRIKEPLYSEVCKTVLDDVRLMIVKSYHYEDITPYTRRIIAKIKGKLPVLRDTKHIGNIDYIETVLDKISKYVAEYPLRVPLVISHGDLQTGNIMYDTRTKRVFIYDWETAGERSIWFDMGKLLLYSQRKGRYAYMIEHRDDQEVKDKLLMLDDRTDYPMTHLISILVLEELEFFVEEILDLPGTMGAEIMDRLTDELKQTTLFA